VIKIPWTKDDAPKHKKGLTEAEKKKWAEIANSVLSDCKKNGGKQKDCEAKAIRIANSKVGGKSNSEDESMNRKKLQAPKGRFTFYSDEPLVELSGGDDGPKTFAMTAYTGAIMPDIFGGSIAVDVDGIEFQGKKRYPILEEHNRERKIGVANKKPDTSNKQVYIDNVIPLSNEKAQEFMTNLEDGFPYQSSISIRPRKIEEVPEGETAEVNNLKFKGPGIIVRSSRFKEASVCVFGRDENTKVQENSEDEEEFEVEVINFNSESEEECPETHTIGSEKDNKKKNSHEGGSMEWKDFKEQYPELAQQIESQFSEKDEQIAEKDRQIKELSDTNSNMTERLKALEKNEAIRREKELQDEAASLIDKQLKQSSIPEHIHDKVHRQFSHKDYLDQEGNLDVEKFTEAVKAEVEDWDNRFSQLEQKTVQGTGGTGDSVVDEKGELDVEKLSDKMAGYVTTHSSKE
jgi:uncharacterized protein YdaT